MRERNAGKMKGDKTDTCRKVWVAGGVMDERNGETILLLHIYEFDVRGRARDDGCVRMFFLAASPSLIRRDTIECWTFSLQE